MTYTWGVCIGWDVFAFLMFLLLTYDFHSIKWIDFSWTVKEFWPRVYLSTTEIKTKSISSHQVIPIFPFQSIPPTRDHPSVASMTLDYFCLFIKIKSGHKNGIRECILLWVASCTQHNVFIDPFILLCVPIACSFFTAQYYFIVWICHSLVILLVHIWIVFNVWLIGVKLLWIFYWVIIDI